MTSISGVTCVYFVFSYQAWNKMADWAYELGQRVVENAAKANNKVDLTHDEKAGADPMCRNHRPNNCKDCRLYWCLIQFIDMDEI